MKTRSASIIFQSWLAGMARRTDAYFLSDALRSTSANRLANVRMGLLFFLAASVGALLFLPFQLSIWSWKTSSVTAILALVLFSLPFVFRQTQRIRYLGDILCGALAIVSAGSMWMSGGQAMGLLAVLPLLPIIGLLVGGRASALVWSAASLGIAVLGLSLLAVDRIPSIEYLGSTAYHHYAIAVLCTVGMAVAALLFETFWNRTAIEVANRAQATLLAREERNSSFLEHATEGVMMVDREAIVRFASPAAERLIGVQPGEAMGHRLREFTVFEDYEATRHIWDRVVETPSELARLTLRTRPGLGKGDAELSRVLDITVSNRLDQPAVQGVIVRMRDVTDLTRAEENYQALVEHSIQGIAVECDGQIVYANQALSDLFHTSPENLVQIRNRPDNNLEFVHHDDRAFVRSQFSKSERTLPEALEMRIMRGDGGWRWLQVQWTEASWEGRSARQIVYADITDSRGLAAHQAAEKEHLKTAIRERTDELEASQKRVREQERMAVVGTLAAGIAHQINNPVGAILTAADFALLTGEEEDADAVQKEALGEIRSQAIRCGKIVRSVLQFARAEPTEKWSSDLHGVLRTAVDVTTRYAEDRGARVDLNFAPSASGHTILMNPIELEQVFVNLIRNALESRTSGAFVRIATSVIEDEVEVLIEDNGSGITEANASQVFDPFFTTRLKDGGTGLGLSVAHGIIEDHSGRMWLENPCPVATAEGPVDDTDNRHSRVPYPEAAARTQVSSGIDPQNDAPSLAGARFRIRIPIEIREDPGVLST